MWKKEQNPGQESRKYLFQEIATLEEQNDQSREEQCPSICTDSIDHTHEETFDKVKKKIYGLKSPKNEDNALGHFCRKETESKWSSRRENQVVKQLREMNEKLFKDNKALLIECIKLKKMLQGSQLVMKQGDNNLEQKLSLLELNLLNHKEEINELKTYNSSLKEEINRLTFFQRDTRGSDSNSLQSSFEILKVENECLRKKIEEFERKELATKFSGMNTTSAMSSSKISTDWERDRIVSNIRMVYEKQIRKLEEEVRSKREEICELSRVKSFSKRRNQSPVVRRPENL